MAWRISCTFLILSFINGAFGQLGVTTCTFATQANCPNFLPNSYCDVDNGLCKCPTVAGYVNDGTGTACTYDCGTLTAPTNGGVSTADGTYMGDVATYSCNNGYKIVGTATRTCVQDVGWSGTAPTCTEGVLGDDCSASTFLCGNIAFGTCKDFSTCECQAGYEDDGTGQDCTEIDQCALSPCQNGGTCTEYINQYTCACVEGYTGANCTTNIDDCVSSPCRNGGTCNDELNRYTCTCASGYTDFLCLTNIDDCLENSCTNGATCVDAIDNYSCVCAQGYSGVFCSEDVDECSSQPCQNDGKCFDGVNGFVCICQAGYIGDRCESGSDECISQPCQNNGTCIDGFVVYTCTCAAGYTGTQCEIDIDECASSPCQKNGTCNDGASGYTCNCVAGYTGTQCETDVNDCASQPCQNSGTCFDGVNGYACTCQTGYTGKNCEKVGEQMVSMKEYVMNISIAVVVSSALVAMLTVAVIFLVLHVRQRSERRKGKRGEKEGVQIIEIQPQSEPYSNLAHERSEESSTYDCLTQQTDGYNLSTL